MSASRRERPGFCIDERNRPPVALARAESTHPVKGRFSRHRLLRAPGMSNVSAPPQASSSPGMLDEPAARFPSRSPLPLILVLFLSALHPPEWDDLLLQFATRLQLARGWPSRRRHVLEFLDQRLVQLNTFGDQQFLIFGE